MELSMSKQEELLKLIKCLTEWNGDQLKVLAEKVNQGYTGWDCDEDYDGMWDKLHKHIKLAEEGNVRSYIHIANLAMFLYNLKVR